MLPSRELQSILSKVSRKQEQESVKWTYKAEHLVSITPSLSLSKLTFQMGKQLTSKNKKINRDFVKKTALLTETLLKKFEQHFTVKPFVLFLLLRHYSGCKLK